MHGQGESYLIRPLEEWLNGGGWNCESEAVRGISLDNLRQLMHCGAEGTADEAEHQDLSRLC